MENIKTSIKSIYLKAYKLNDLIQKNQINLRQKHLQIIHNIKYIFLFKFSEELLSFSLNFVKKYKIGLINK